MPLIPVTTGASIILTRNRNRKSFIIQNEDASINVFVKRERGPTLTVSSSDHDHRISPSGLLALNNQNDGAESIQDQWTIISASGSPNVSVFETEDVVR